MLTLRPDAMNTPSGAGFQKAAHLVHREVVFLVGFHARNRGESDQANQQKERPPGTFAHRAALMTAQGICEQGLVRPGFP